MRRTFVVPGYLPHEVICSDEHPYVPPDPVIFVSNGLGEDLGWGRTTEEALLMAYAHHAKVRPHVRWFFSRRPR